MKKLLAVLVLCLPIAALAVYMKGGGADAAEKIAHFKVGTKVLVKDPPRFGVNFEFPALSHWSGYFPENQWNTDCSFEPVRFRHMDFAKGGGRNFLSNPAKSPQGQPEAGTGYWDSFLDGWFDGADVRIYRQAPTGAVSLLRKDKVRKFTGGDKSENKIYLEKDGPAIQAGDLYILDITLANLRRTRQKSEEHGPFEREPEDDPNVAVSYDDKTFAPEGGSTTSLRVSLKGGEQPGGIGRFFMGLKQGGERRRDWSRFPDKATFRFSLWLKQEGLRTGEITLAVGENLTHTWRVTREWQQYSFDFKAVTPDELCRLTLLANGPGTFWVDNFVLYDTSVPVFAVNSKYLQALKDYRPGFIRVWSGVNQGARGGQSLDSWLAGPFAANACYNWDEARMPAPRPDLFTILKMCQDVGANPWLITSPAFSEQEYANLMEYLGGPASTPYGKIRHKQGQEKPWLEVFDDVYIEIGNEQWNETFAPLAFPGNPQFYGGYANLAFRAMKASPYYDQARVRFVLSGWATDEDWNKTVVKYAPLADRIGFANYCSGWDSKTIVAKNDAEAFFNCLYYHPRVLAPLMEGCQASLSGKVPRLVVYEAGPGYELPGADKPSDPAQERIGKSLATAIATMDSFMDNAARGFEGQCYFMFRPGVNWASHAWEHDWRPHAAFLALEMRNRYCTGDLVEVKPVRVPRINLPAAMTQTKESLPAISKVPTVAAYAFQDAKKHSFVLISREPSAAVRVTLELPYDPKAEAKLYRLTADKPSANNIERTEVPIQESVLRDLSRSYTFDLPPHSIYVIVNEER